MALCCLLICFARARMANTKPKMSIKELVELVSDKKEFGCASGLLHLAPTPLHAFPSQGWHLIDNKLLFCVSRACHTDL